MSKETGTAYSSLPRSFGMVTATALVVANMVGSGIFTTSGILAGQLPHPLWVLVCWLLGGLIALMGALCYAELATRMPSEGGEYVYLKRLFHPSLGFLTGWTSFFVGFSAPIALSALGFAAYLFAGLKNFDLLSNGSLGELEVVQKVVAIAVIAGFTGLHYLGGRIGSRVQNGLTVLKIALILGLALLGLIYGRGSWSNVVSAPAQPFNLMSFGTAMMLVMFAYSGWNASAYIAGELKEPKRTLPVSLAVGTLIVMLLYLLLNAFYFHALPFDASKGTITIAERAMAVAFSPGIADLLAAMIGLILLSSLSAFIMIGPRVYYAMACDGLFFRFARRVHSRYKVPGQAIIVQGVIAIMMVLVGSFQQLLAYVGFALGIFPWLAVYGLFKARKLKIGENIAVRVWGYPYIPILFLAANLFLMVIAYINRPIESTAAIVTVLLGVPIYFQWWSRQKLRGSGGVNSELTENR